MTQDASLSRKCRLDFARRFISRGKSRGTYCRATSLDGERTFRFPIYSPFRNFSILSRMLNISRDELRKTRFSSGSGNFLIEINPSVRSAPLSVCVIQFTVEIFLHSQSHSLARLENYTIVHHETISLKKNDRVLF